MPLIAAKTQTQSGHWPGQGRGSREEQGGAKHALLASKSTTAKTETKQQQQCRRAKLLSAEMDMELVSVSRPRACQREGGTHACSSSLVPHRRHLQGPAGWPIFLN